MRGKEGWRDENNKKFELLYTDFLDIHQFQNIREIIRVYTVDSRAIKLKQAHF